MLHSIEELKELDIEVGYDETTTFGNYRIRVMADDNPESPREWDNLGTMVCWHGRYNLGDVDGAKEYNDPIDFFYELSGLEIEPDDGLGNFTDDQKERIYDEAYRKNIILPLYLYDHSGITMNTTGFSCGWDSGQVGYIYVSLEKVREEYSCKRVSKKMRERIEKYLTGEVETYDMFLRGDVYGFSVVREDEDGEEVDIDSCWGFYGYDDPYMTEDVIKGAIQYDIENTPAQLELAV
jgi:hypothetical protein